MSDFANVDRPYGQHPETRAAAARYIVRTQPDFAELLFALGLARDPVADEANRRKAAAALIGRGGPPAGGAR